jgi:DNA-binding transcriptional ArsR family regulator
MENGDVEVPAGFRLVADETRAAILYALAERMREHPEDPALGFSDLRRAVGVRDSGNFNYHLDKLRGRFVEKTPDGYALTHPGSAVVAALVGGAYDDADALGPEPYGEPCPLCGDDLVVTYEDGLVTLQCEGDDHHGVAYNLPPHAVDADDLPAAADLMARRAHAETGLLADGRCPMCFGEVALSSVELPDEALPPGLDAACRRCGMHYALTVGHVALHHPEVAAFLADDGDPRRSPTAQLRLGLGADAEQVGEGRYRVAVEREGETLAVTVDDDGAVLDVDHDR